MNGPRFFLLLTLITAGLAFGSVALAQMDENGLANKGYDPDLRCFMRVDPVAYFTDARQTVGDPQYQYKWDGAIYRFESARHLELFKADPERYLPQPHNMCTASLARGGIKV
jgi:YHS domain-containing protein